jgi:pathogenesis-related protein 1
MNRITISLIFLIVISMVLPTSAIMYVSGQSATSDNSGSSSGGSTISDNSTAGSAGPSTKDNSGSSSTGGSSTPSTTTTDNSATLPTTSTASNNTGNTQRMDVNGILAVHNQERAAVGVPLLTWSDTLAASAQTWAEHLIAIGKIEHSTGQPYGENLAWAGPPSAKTQPGLAESWADEKKNYVQGTPGDSSAGHYTQMVWKDTKQVGCGFASGPSGPGAQYGGTDVLVCQYTPPGNWNNQLPY